jgi:hypothetical protein
MQVPEPIEHSPERFSLQRREYGVFRASGVDAERVIDPIGGSRAVSLPGR